MIRKLFPTHIIECEDLLEQDDLQDIYNFVALNLQDTIITPKELPALSSLRNKITEKAKLLAEEYSYSDIEVSNRFSTHFYHPKEKRGMETHSDDLGDAARKFIAFYYLEAEDNLTGQLEILDPRWVNSPWRDISENYKITPKTNKLVIFPTFLWHKVTDYYSESYPRMAVDVVVKIC